MAIKLNDILNFSDNEINNSRIELNMRDVITGEKYIDRWLALVEEEKISGFTDFSYRSWYSQKQRNFSKGQFVFSFVRMEESDKWLFISAAKIIDTPVDKRAEIEILEKYKPFFGRLVIKYYKGNTRSVYCFRAKKIMDSSCIVTQVLENLYGSKSFPGFADLLLDYGELKQNIYSDSWKGPLSSVNGIYLLNDKSTGKKYVGSASGEEGIFGRWKTYLDDGYDATEEESGKVFPNSQLKKLVKEKGLEYIENNFQFSILEVIPKTTLIAKIIERENYWKNVLGTRDKNFGYNSN